MKARHIIGLLGLALTVVSLFFLMPNESASAARGSVGTKLQPENPRVLVIGDSLSVGAFGEALQLFLTRKFSPQNVASFASCGSSPEHWLASQRAFITHCGYRESTPGRAPILRDAPNRRGTITPKLESLVRRYDPSILIVQLGTNWMDRRIDDREIASILHRFVVAARKNSSVRNIIWIEPPDSSAMARSAQVRIHNLIKQAAARENFEAIDSRPLTKYVRGKTGGDGVHYNSASSRAWASRLIPILETKLPPRVTTAR